MKSLYNQKYYIFGVDMFYSKSFYLFVFMIVLSGTLFSEAIIYPYSTKIERSLKYSAQLDGHAVPVIKTRVGDLLSFGIKEQTPVEIIITLKKEAKSVVIRPLSSGIKGKIEGKKCRFILDRPINISVEFDNNLKTPLFVFADAEIKKMPDKEDPKVIFFDAGKIHRVGEIFLKDDQTLFLEAGAIVEGVVRTVNSKNVTIAGAGIFDCRPRKYKTNMIVVRNSEKVKIQNIILIGTYGWSVHLSGSNDVDVSNLRVLSWRANCDGLDIEYSSNIDIEKCFWRTSDDCISLKAIYPPNIEGVPLNEMINPETLGKHKVSRIDGDVMENILVKNCVFWNDIPGNAFEIGFELRIDHLQNVVLQDSDIIHVKKGAAFSIHNSDRVAIKNILLDDIRVEDVDELIDFYIGLSIYSDDCPTAFRRSNPLRRSPPLKNKDFYAHDNINQWYIPKDLELHASYRGTIEDVRVKDMKAFLTPRTKSIISGYDENHAITNVVFENLQIEGRVVRALEDRLFYVRNASDINFTD